MMTFFSALCVINIVYFCIMTIDHINFLYEHIRHPMYVCENRFLCLLLTSTSKAIKSNFKRNLSLSNFV